MIMQPTTKRAVTLAAAIVTLGSLHTLSQQAPIQAQDWQNNDFTNKIVMPTPESFTNNLAAVSIVQQTRLAQQSTPKGAAAMQQGPRVEAHPPSTLMNSEPWVQQDHPWDINPAAPGQPSFWGSYPNSP
jgi:hypothetical protein